MAASINTSTTTPRTRRSCWCSRRSRCSCSCTSCSRRSSNGRPTSRPPARRTTSRRPTSEPERAMSTQFEEKGPAHTGSATCTFRAEDVAASEAVRKQYETRTNVVHAEDMPFENSADGLIKHIVHRRMDTRECCVEAYMQFLKAGERSGKHRHMWEEVIFVVEGTGYDLHWDMKFDCLEAFEWDWAPEPKRFEWKRGDYI